MPYHVGIHQNRRERSPRHASQSPEPTGSIRCPRLAERGRAHGSGRGRAHGRRQGAADHRQGVRGSPLHERTGSGARGDGAARQFDSGLWLRRAQRGQLRPDLPGTRARRLRAAQLRLGAVEPVHVPDLGLRHRGTETEISAGHGPGNDHRLLRPDGASWRLGSREHEDARQAPAAATGSSTARRCGSRTHRLPISASRGR